MARPRMFYRTQTKSYYVKLNGKFVSLGRDEQAARKRYQELVPSENQAYGTDVESFVNSYLDYLSVNRAKRTFETAAWHLHDFVQYLGPNFPAQSVMGKHLQAWADKRFANLSDTYKNQGMRTVKACWSWGSKMDSSFAHTLRAVPLPTPGQCEDFIEAKHWIQIVDTAKSQEFKDYLTVMLESGPRPQEIREVRVRHWFPDFNTLVFERKTSKGKKERRVIPLNPASVEIVKRLIAQRSGPNDYIFLNTQGRPWNKSSVNCQMRRLRAKLPLPLRAYVLRHSYAHANLVQGGDPMAVSKAMGHRDTKMIETRYGHVEKNIDFLKRGKTLKNNPFVPDTNDENTQIIELPIYDFSDNQQL